MTGLRVLLVDDHPVVRAGLRAMLGDFDGLEIAAEAADGAAAIAEVARQEALGTPFDVVLMDLQMGSGPDGAEATRRIRAAGGPPVLILTTYDSDADILAAVDAGAAGYMLKDAAPEEIRAAVAAAAQGRTALAPQVAGRLLGQLRSPEATLSPRELELLQLLADGMANRAIARQLFISEATVKTHLVHIYEKLGVDNRTAAVNEARKRRIIRR
ncbi:response regulator transcription factor [Arthrobacter gengyunqii]|uniref:Response regulator transcription factor n=1 Tax=Arthrobacter gengyunqii TaxID=2886940 RepID=A0A9X1M0X4_9MICC|nr:response regulator transcription factor [Arthrobacter gengyunqii]MCC3269408.1 response regulator transcription factor [Arthrobacter gengyunqii]UOY94646.1 response regulator transcription factor [Arthrobacter gengyunqii]